MSRRRISELYKSDRPREKIGIKGPNALSDHELLMAIIGSGGKQADVDQIARSALKHFQKHGANVSHEQLKAVTGLGNAKTAQLLAAIELSRRYLTVNEQPIIDSVEIAVEQVKDIRNKRQEHFVVMTLDGANRLIEKRTVTIGTLTSSLVHPREVFSDAITDRAASIIVAHNHPSGDTTPSIADKTITRKLAKAAELLGVELLDHIIVTKKSHLAIIGNLF